MPISVAEPAASAAVVERTEGGQDSRLFVKVGRCAEHVLSIVITVNLLSIMLLTVCDVVGRYFLSRPIPGALEVTELLLGALIFSALPLVTLRNEHIVIDLLDKVIPSWLVTVQSVVVAVFTSVCCAYLAYRLWVLADRLQGAGETTATLGIPIAPLAFAISVFVGLTAVTALLTMVVPPPEREGGEGHV